MNDEDKRLHLQLIQGVVSRLASNSFLIKGWSVTLISALFALAAAKADPLFVYLAYFPSFAFWSLDAYYLRQERLSRRLYDHVAGLDAPEINYSMDTSAFETTVQSQFCTGFSATLRMFHGTVTGTIVVVMFALIFTK